MTINIKTELLLVNLVIFMALAACDFEDEEDYSPEQGKMGLITARLSRQPGDGPENRTERFEVAGHFVRYEGLGTVEVAEIIGEDIPYDVELDTCSHALPDLLSSSQDPLELTRQVELIDVGNITVRFGSRKQLLPARNFPDLMNLITGVIYAGDETQGFSFNPSHRFELRTYGSGDVDPFVLVGRSPGDLSISSIGDVDPDMVESLMISQGEVLEVKWDSPEEDSAGEAIIEISWNMFDIPYHVECRVNDDGDFTVPGEITAMIPENPAGTDALISIIRVRTFRSVARGLDSVEFRFLIQETYSLGL